MTLDALLTRLEHEQVTRVTRPDSMTLPAKALPGLGVTPVTSELLSKRNPPIPSAVLRGWPSKAVDSETIAACNSAGCIKPLTVQASSGDGDRTVLVPTAVDRMETPQASVASSVDQGLATNEPTAMDVVEFIEERAAVAEFDGGLNRDQAERQAFRRAVVHFCLHEFHGEPPQRGGGTLIGSATDTVNSLLAELRVRYGTRLVDTALKGRHEDDRDAPHHFPEI